MSKENKGEARVTFSVIPTWANVWAFFKHWSFHKPIEIVIWSENEPIHGKITSGEANVE